MPQNKLVEFGRIDQSGDPGYFIRFLDEACAQESFRAYKRQSYEILTLRPGLRVLDVGCGTGDDARDIAGMVGASGKVVGLDNSQAMVDEARRRAAGLNLPLEFHVGDAMHMSYADGAFDVVRADRSFMHIPDPKKALAEMVRVTSPGGRVLVDEVDFETVTIDAPDRSLARRIVNTWCDGFRDGWLGRRMPAMFRDVGLSDIVVVPMTLVLTPMLAHQIIGAQTVARAKALGAITDADGQTWLQYLDDVARSGRLFCTLTGFIVCGQK
jgi:ubiquinone/menaquinone biosynthesis C-methylase UbiE